MDSVVWIKKRKMLFALLTSLILSQLAFAMHQIDFGLHADNEACELCLHHTSFDDETTSAQISKFIPLQDFALTHSETILVSESSRHYHTRAPPSRF